MSKNGGPAFPVIGAPGAPEDYPGMTLRDYFAAKAMQGLLAHPRCNDVGREEPETTEYVAEEAYAVADAMLAERDK
jgi:hypothetical protein